MKFLSNDYTNTNTNPKSLTTLTLTLTDPHDAFESFCASVFRDFIRNYFLETFGLLDTYNFYHLQKAAQYRVVTFGDTER